jgi:ABC-type branched-subunit amino acid transport system ATPase component/nitrogen-specific signal transduction histidine kinase
MTSFNNLHIQLDSVSVDYGHHIGIEDVTLSIPRGEIFALVGDHGAGKTTITNVLCGAIRPNSGFLMVNGQRYEYLSPEIAIRLGIVAIHQNMMVVPALSAYENVFLNREKRRNLFQIDHPSMRDRLHEALRILGADNIDIDRPIGEYRRDRQQIVELARIICFPSDIIIIDEISARLSPGVLENIHHILSVLRNQGRTILYVSHDMREVVDFSSQIAVLRNGRVNRVVSASDVNELELMQLTYSSLRRREDLEADNATLYYQKTFTENVTQRLPLPILVVDSESRVRIANSAFCRAFSLQEPDLVGFDFANLTLFPAQLRERIDAVLATHPGGQIDSVDLPFSDEEVIASLHFFKLFDDESFLGTVYFLDTPPFRRNMTVNSEWNSSDVPDVKRQLRHEINNALGTILNHIRIARMADDHAEVDASILIIEEETRRIRRIVQEKTSSASSENDLRRLVEKTCSLVRAEMNEKSITFEQTVPAELSSPIPEDQLQQILLNLLFNSIEAVEPGGSVSVRACGMRIGDRDFVEFVVADDGRGIPVSDVPFVFSPFFSSKRSDSTHGVGLALCKSIVEETGGSIDCRSTEGRGTEMRFYLPVPAATSGS